MTEDRRDGPDRRTSPAEHRLQDAQQDLAVALGLHHDGVTVEELTARIKRLRSLLYTHGIDSAISELQSLRELVRATT